MRPLRISGTVVLPASDLTARAVRSSGPGGQNVNKVSSKVELRFDLAGTAALADDAKARLRALARGRLDADGQLVITSQAERDLPRNLADARQKLADLVAQALVAPRPRRATRPSAAAKRRRVDAKKRRGAVKRTRRAQADE